MRAIRQLRFFSIRNRRSPENVLRPLSRTKRREKSPPPYSLETNYPENNKKRKIDFREDFQHPATLGNARSDSRINYWPHPLLSKVLQLSRTYSNLVSFQVKKFQDDEHNFHPSLWIVVLLLFRLLGPKKAIWSATRRRRRGWYLTRPWREEKKSPRNRKEPESSPLLFFGQGGNINFSPQIIIKEEEEEEKSLEGKETCRRIETSTFQQSGDLPWMAGRWERRPCRCGTSRA